MRYPFVSFLLCLLALFAGHGIAQERAPAIVLADGGSAFSVSTNIAVWLEPGRQESIATVAQSPALFSSVHPDDQHDLLESNTLWIKLNLRHPAGAAQAWILSIALPFSDSVVLYQRNAGGSWAAQSAGNQLPQSKWSKAGLYPEFEVTPKPGLDSEVYLQVRNFKNLNVPLRFTPTQSRDSQRMAELAALGAILGALLSLAALSIIRFAEHRNRADLLASAYGFTIALTIASLNGLAGMVLWPNSASLSSYAQTGLPPLTLGLALLLLRELYAISTRHRRYDTLLVYTAYASIASTVSLLLLDRALAHITITAMTLFAACIGLVGALFSWRFRSTVGRWLFASFALQFLSMLWLIADLWGVVRGSWEFRYLASLATALTVPLLMYALSHATHDRKELAVRANHLPNQDALTGLLTQEAFMQQYEAAYERVINDGEPVAVVLINVINHEHIRQAMGDTTAEQCLLRAVIKLQRVLRDVDPAGRVDSSRFGLILEGVADKDALTGRMVRLIASGLTPIPGLAPEVTLQFQAACVLLHHNPVPPERLLHELGGILEEMSPRSRRPIRFLEAASTQPAPSILN